MAVVGRVALDDAHTGPALASALRALHAPVVERDREAAPRLRVQLGQVAAAGERALEDARRQLEIDERHSRSDTRASMLSASSMMWSCPRASGWIRRAYPAGSYTSTRGSRSRCMRRTVAAMPSAIPAARESGPLRFSFTRRAPASGGPRPRA